MKGGGLQGFRLMAGIKALKTRTKGATKGPMSVPMDLYGHTPTEVTQFKSWTGFVFSLIVIITVAASVGYVVYEYITLPYDLAESRGLYDPEFMAGPETEVPIPEFGVQVVTGNRTFLEVDEFPEVVDIFFWQNFIFGDGAGGICPGEFEGERCRKRVRIPSERCRFLATEKDDINITAFCPMWGYLDESIDENGAANIDFVPTGDRFNATVPAVQGNFMDPEYSFMEATVSVNFTGVENRLDDLQISLDDIYSGQIAYVTGYTRHVLFDIGINDAVPLKYVRWSRAVEIKEQLTSSVDIPLKSREIAKGNFIVDFDFLESEFADIVIGEVAQELDDAVYTPTLFNLQNATGLLPQRFNTETGLNENVTAPETILLSQAFFHIDREATVFQMTPPSTIFDILGLVGGFLSLFSLMIGWPAMIINQWMFSRKLKRAMESGKLPKDYLDKDGAVRVDKANEVVQKLNAMDDGVSLQLWRRRWRRKQRSMSSNRRNSEVAASSPAPPTTSTVEQ